MKTLRISDSVHEKLTALLGDLVAQTRKMQTYQDAIEAMLNESVVLPVDLLKRVEEFIQENKQLGYTSREEFIRDATRYKLGLLTDQFEYIDIEKEEYQKLSSAIKDMDLPFTSVEDFLNQQIDRVLEDYDRGKELAEENEDTY